MHGRLPLNWKLDPAGNLWSLLLRDQSIPIKLEDPSQIFSLPDLPTSLLSASHMEGEKKELCITLRPFELTDLSDVMAWVADDRIARWCWWDAVQSIDEAQSFLERFLIAHPWARAICVDGRPIGQVTFKQGADIERCRGEIGYAVAFDHWGKGIATEALKMAVSAIFCQFLEIERIDALVTHTNAGSQRVLEKFGFVKEGLLSKYRLKKGEALDMFVYSILAS